MEARDRSPLFFSVDLVYAHEYFKNTNGRAGLLLLIQRGASLEKCHSLYRKRVCDPIFNTQYSNHAGKEAMEGSDWTISVNGQA